MQASAQAFSSFENSSTVCACFSLLLKIRADVMLAVLGKLVFKSNLSELLVTTGTFYSLNTPLVSYAVAESLEQVAQQKCRIGTSCISLQLLLREN